MYIFFIFTLNFFGNALVLNSFYVQYCSILEQFKKSDLNFARSFLSKYKTVLVDIFNGILCDQTFVFFWEKDLNWCILRFSLLYMCTLYSYNINASIINLQKGEKRLICLALYTQHICFSMLCLFWYNNLWKYFKANL